MQCAACGHTHCECKKIHEEYEKILKRKKEGIEITSFEKTLVSIIEGTAIKHIPSDPIDIPL